MSDTRRFEAMSFSGIMDASFRLYAQNFVKLVGISLLCMLPNLVVQIMGPLTGNALGLIIVLIGLLVSVLGSFVLIGALTLAISDIYMGNEVDVKSVIQRSLKLLGPIFMTQLLVSCWIFLGLLLFVIPAIIWGFTMALVVPVVVLEGWTGNQALQRSKELVNSQRGKSIGVILMSGLIAFGLTIMLQGGAAVVFGVTGLIQVGNGMLLNATSVLLSALIQPFSYIVLVMLYYDARIRKEGFDLEMLGTELAKL